MKKFTPRCISDYENPKCRAYIAIYKKTEDVNEEVINGDGIYVRKGFDASFSEEIRCRILEWHQSDFRVRFKHPDTDEEMDFWYHQDLTFMPYRNYFYVLRFEVEDDFISTCL